MGFAVLILTFGGVSVVTVENMDRLSRQIRVIRTGYLQLALNAKDLAEKQKNLHQYLMEEVTSEPSPSRLASRVLRFRLARRILLKEADAIVAEQANLPLRKPMRAAASEIASFRRQAESLEAYYKILLETPAAVLDGGGRAVERSKTAPAVLALEQLRKAEHRLYSKMDAHARRQRALVEGTALGLEQAERKLRLYTIYLGVTAVVVGLLITLWATLTLRPLRRLRDGAAGIARGYYTSRIPENGPYEVADLAHEFNTMAQAIERRERELVRSERLAAIGKMAAMITHEVRNPLSSIGLNTELLEEELAGLGQEETEEARNLCRAITREVDRLTAITEEYLQFARLPKPRLHLEPLAPILEGLVDFEREQLLSRGVVLELDVAADLPPVLVDDAQLRQALLNLLRNAGEAVGECGGGKVWIRTARSGSGEHVEIQVTDTGPGVAEELMPRLFEPFVSGKRSGTGLGLALTHQIVREHGGSIHVSSRAGQGATFVVSLPVPVTAEQPAPVRAAGPEARDEVVAGREERQEEELHATREISGRG